MPGPPPRSWLLPVFEFIFRVTAFAERLLVTVSAGLLGGLADDRSVVEQHVVVGDLLGAGGVTVGAVSLAVAGAAVGAHGVAGGGLGAVLEDPQTVVVGGR